MTVIELIQFISLKISKVSKLQVLYNFSPNHSKFKTRVRFQGGSKSLSLKLNSIPEMSSIFGSISIRIPYYACIWTRKI